MHWCNTFWHPVTSKIICHATKILFNWFSAFTSTKNKQTNPKNIIVVLLGLISRCVSFYFAICRNGVSNYRMFWFIFVQNDTYIMDVRIKTHESCHFKSSLGFPQINFCTEAQRPHCCSSCSPLFLHTIHARCPCGAELAGSVMCRCSGLVVPQCVCVRTGHQVLLISFIHRCALTFPLS